MKTELRPLLSALSLALASFALQGCEGCNMPVVIDDGDDGSDERPPPPDSDGDGVPDARDNCHAVPNAGQRDGDADGVGDACDNCPATPNPDQADVCSPPPCPDGDGDGVCDADDNCPATPNPDQADVCSPPPCPDRDGDGVCDAGDNCPDTGNPAQTDGDGDGLGDACDPCPGQADPAGCPPAPVGLTLELGGADAAPGDPVELPLLLGGPLDPVAALQVDVLFDDAVLAVDANPVEVAGDAQAAGKFVQANDLGGGRLRLVLIGLDDRALADSDQSGEVDLATLRFVVRANAPAGATDLVLDGALLSDPAGDPVAFDEVDGEITVR